MYDGIQAYGERDVKLEASGDIFIYANNNGIDNDDTKENYDGSGGQVRISALNGSNVIIGGINRQDGVKEGDGIRTQGTGSIIVEATETNKITGYDVGVFVEESSTQTTTSGAEYNILVTADGNGLETGKIANTIIGHNNGIEVASDSKDVKVGVLAENGDNYIEGLKSYNSTDDGGTWGYGISTNGGHVEVHAKNGVNYIGGVIGINADNGGYIKVESSSGAYVFATDQAVSGTEDYYGVRVSNGSQVNFQISSGGCGDIVIGAFKKAGDVTSKNYFNEAVTMAGGTAVFKDASGSGTNLFIASGAAVHLKTNDENKAVDNVFTSENGINEFHTLSGKAAVWADNGSSGSIYIYAIDFDGSNKIIASGDESVGILTGDNSTGMIYLLSYGNNQIYAGGTAIEHNGSQTITIEANDFDGSRNEDNFNYVAGGYDFDNNTLKEGDKANGITLTGEGSITLKARGNYVFGSQYGVQLTDGVKELADDKDNIQITATSSSGNSVTGANAGIMNESATGKISLIAEAEEKTVSYPYKNPNPESGGTNLVYATADASSGIYTKGGQITLVGQYGNTVYGKQTGIDIYGGSVSLTSSSGANNIFGDDFGIHVGENAAEGTQVILSGTANNIEVYGSGDEVDSADGINLAKNSSGSVSLTATSGNNTIFAKASAENIGGDGIYTAQSSTGDVTLNANAGSNYIAAQNNGIDSSGSGNITLTAASGTNAVYGSVNFDTESIEQTGPDGAGIRVAGDGTVSLQGKSNIVSGWDAGIKLKVADTEPEEGHYSVMLDAENNSVTGHDHGIDAEGGTALLHASGDSGYNMIVAEEGSGIRSVGAQITVTADQGSNYVLTPGKGIDALSGSVIDFTAGGSNFIQAGQLDVSGNATADAYAIDATGGSKLSFKAKDSNSILGAAMPLMKAQ